MGGGRGAERLPEQRFEAPGGKADGSCGLGGGFGAVDPRLHPGQRLRDAGVEGGVLRGDLRFMAVADGGEETCRHLTGQRRAVAAADQVEHEVLGRGGARDRDAVAVDHEAVGDDIDMGMGGGEVLKVFPMDGGAVAVEKPGAGEDPRGGVDPSDEVKARRDAAEVADQRAGRDLGQAIAGDDDQRIRAHGMGKRAGGGEFDAAGQRHWRAVRRDDAPAESLMPEVAVGVAQGVERRGDLEDRRLGQDEERDGQRLARGVEDDTFRHADFVRCKAAARKAAMVGPSPREDSNAADHEP